MTTENTATFQIPASTEQVIVHAYDLTDKANPRKVEAGVVTATRYIGEDVQRLSYQDAQTEKLYRMGATSNRFAFVDHTEAIDPFLAAGYKLQKFNLFRGGLQMAATLTAPDSVLPVQDPINWDLGFWRDRLSAGSVDQQLHHSVNIVSGIKPGKGINIDSGWYRLVCTNGMMAKILGLPGTRFSHSNYSVEVLQQKYLAAPVLNALEAPKTDALMGAFIGNPTGTEKFAKLLDKLSAQIGGENDEDSDDDDNESSKMNPRIFRKLSATQELPFYLTEMITPFTRQPLWMLRGLAEQFHTLAADDTRTKYYALDVVNAVTNPVNLHRGPISGRPVLQQNSLTDAASKLIGAFSL